MSWKTTLRHTQNGIHLESGATLNLLRQLMVVACEPGALGAMTGGAAPTDPIFWVLHPIFEKALHVLKLVPTFRDAYNFSWVDHDCGSGVSGGGLDDKLPFSGE